MNIKNLTIYGLFIVLVFVTFSCTTKAQKEVSIKDAYEGRFLVGVALNAYQAVENDSLCNIVVKNHFNTIVAENCMKSECIQPEEGIFDFKEPDSFVAYGEKNSMFIIGHCLLWHSQAPSWFFIDETGEDVSREVMIERIKKHITTLVTRYKGRVNGWDVVNEAFNEDGTMRNSKFLQIIGEDYIELAFKFANEADPTAQLYYNDYNTFKEGKRMGIVKLVKQLQEKGLRIDAVGMQMHTGIKEPAVTEYDASIKAFAASGVNVMITELDITVIPWPSNEVTAEISTNFELKKEYNPYPDGLPDSVNNALAERYQDLFDMLLDNHEVVTRVTLWGVNDGNTWRNNWPVHGRSDYPLLFDRQYQPKLAVEKIIALTHVE